ncbi:hypothetical protein [Neorhizobium petrolearium]|uniref:Uncharacterized protein n=1 Tax=Neorhizobium petrolearium TaxID=515361 RepID=A0ABY8M5U9_9HYPH|nr:hypothetical protein [Neorhizobium petrolearium]MCC2609721.1 hypothetical protein [Neorhizobium petrolearium]WGI69915.1 hypothetical protein QEO92_07625 [Neorhizobium petrolearium]
MARLNPVLRNLFRAAARRNGHGNHLRFTSPGEAGCALSLDHRFAALEMQLEERLHKAGWSEEGKIPSSAAAGMISSVARWPTLKARSGRSARELEPIAQAATIAAAVLNSVSRGFSTHRIAA